MSNHQHTDSSEPRDLRSLSLPNLTVGRRGFLIGAGAAAFLAACGGDDSPSSDDSSSNDDSSSAGDIEDSSSSDDSTNTQSSGEPIKIGYVAALTGAVAAYGTQTLNALQLAAEHVNARGGILGRQVEIEAVDNESSPDNVPSLMRRLSDDGCNLLFGASASPPTIVAAQTADQLQIPLIVPMEAADAIIGEGREYVFKVAPSVLKENGWAAQSVRAVMESASTQDIDISSVVIVNATSGAFPDALTAWERTLSEEYPDVEILDVLTYDEAATSDYAPLVSQAQALDPDMLIFGGNPKGSFAFYPALAQSGWSPKVTTGMLGGNTNTAFIETVGAEAAEGDVAGNYWTPNLPARDGSEFSPQQFFDDYAAKYGDNPDGVGAYYYACLGIAADAIEAAGTYDDREAILSALRATDIDGTSGDTRGMFIVGHGAAFGEDGLNQRAAGVVTQIQDGEYIPVFPPDVSLSEIQFNV